MNVKSPWRNTLVFYSLIYVDLVGHNGMADSR